MPLRTLLKTLKQQRSKYEKEALHLHHICFAIGTDKTERSYLHCTKLADSCLTYCFFLGELIRGIFGGFCIQLVYLLWIHPLLLLRAASLTNILLRFQHFFSVISQYSHTLKKKLCFSQAKNSTFAD